MEYEQSQTLATLVGLKRIAWDALGQYLFVEFQAGPTGSDSWPVALTQEAAEQLLIELQTCVEERMRAEGTMQ